MRSAVPAAVLGIGRRLFGGGAGAPAPAGAAPGGGVDIAARPAAEALAARLPALLADAERVAATVGGGVHGRLRPGSGDSFWQFRPLAPGESAGRIDWRQSARSDRLFVRETEWEAAQTVCLWRDRSPSMRWRSDRALPSKLERAELAMLALGILLLRGGEHLALLDTDALSRFSGRRAVERLALHLTIRLGEPGSGGSLPPPANLPPHAVAVLIGDFLSPVAEIAAMLGALSAIPVRPLLVQVLDPAELTLPYDGRTRFEGVEGEAPLLVSDAAGIRGGYRTAVAAHQDALAALCAGTGTTLLRHRTDARPETLLLALHQAIAPARRRGPDPGHHSGPGPGAPFGAASPVA